MSQYEANAIGTFVLQTARQQQTRNANIVTCKQICDRFNATMDFIRLNIKTICQWLLDSIDVIDVDETEDGDIDIIVKKRAY